MQKNTTLSNREVSTQERVKKQEETSNLQPSKKTIQNILQFAAAYRPERISENQFTEIYLN